MENAMVLLCKRGDVSCGVLLERTLSFQSLMMKLGAKWKDLTKGSFSLSYSFDGHPKCLLEPDENLCVLYALALSSMIDRVDVVVKDLMLEILTMMLLEVRGKPVSLGIGLEVSEVVMDFICKQGYDRSYGARPLRRAVTRLVDDPLSDTFHSGLLKPSDTAIIDLDDSRKPIVRNQSSQNIELSDTFL